MALFLNLSQQRREDPYLFSNKENHVNRERIASSTCATARIAKEGLIFGSVRIQRESSDYSQNSLCSSHKASLHTISRGDSLSSSSHLSCRAVEQAVKRLDGTPLGEEVRPFPASQGMSLVKQHTQELAQENKRLQEMISSLDLEDINELTLREKEQELARISRTQRSLPVREQHVKDFLHSREYRNCFEEKSEGASLSGFFVWLERNDFSGPMGYVIQFIMTWLGVSEQWKEKALLKEENKAFLRSVIQGFVDLEQQEQENIRLKEAIPQKIAEAKEHYEENKRIKKQHDRAKLEEQIREVVSLGLENPDWSEFRKARHFSVEIDTFAEFMSSTFYQERLPLILEKELQGIQERREQLAQESEVFRIAFETSKQEREARYAEEEAAMEREREERERAMQREHEERLQKIKEDYEEAQRLYAREEKISEWELKHLSMQDQDDLDKLGLEPGCDNATIRARYRELSLHYHPDKNRDLPEYAHKLFTLLTEAKERLLSQPREARVHLHRGFEADEWDDFRDDLGF